MGNMMRISGLASGMDTDTMVKQLMDAEKIRLNKYNSNKQVKIWNQEAYNNVNKDIANFILDTKKELELMKTTASGSFVNGSTGNFSWVKKAASGDTTKIDAIATADAQSGTHSISVAKLAKGVTVASSGDVEDKKLSDLIGVSGDYEITINGAAIKLSKDDTLESMVTKINSTNVGVKANYDAKAKRFFMSTTGTGSSNKINITEPGKSSDPPVSGDPKYLFRNDGTGTSILKLNVNYRDGSDVDKSEGMKLSTNYTGGNAQIDFDGATSIKYESNQFTINGISVSLKDIGTTTVKVDTDVDGVYNKIKSFVDKYNELIDKLNTKVSEKKYRDYQPLTEEQKKAMDKDTIKLWEDKAKSGLLKNDENINKITNNTRSGLYECVYDTYDSSKPTTGKISGYSMLTEIGITTGSYQEKGKLKIDEKGLRTAISNNADGVINLLFKTSDITDTQINAMPTGTDAEKMQKAAKITERRKESGVLTRVYDDLVDGMKNIIDKSGTGENAPLYRQVKSNILIDFVTKSGSISILDKDVLSLEKQIKNENVKLSRKEESYYRRFTALEKAMNKMNSQSSWLAGQLGSK